MKVKIEFKIEPKAKSAFECKGISNTLHEALCLAIHEGNKKALEWLSINVIDIKREML